MKYWTFACILSILLSCKAFGQLNRHDAQSVLTEFLKNSSDGRYVGWSGNRNDSLRLIASDYVDYVESFNKSFQFDSGDDIYYAKSSSLDSIQIFSDHAFGYVTLSVLCQGYCIERMPLLRQEIYKTYLLIRKRSYWYVLSETLNMYISVDAYIKWAEKYISDKTRTEEPEYRNNVINNLKDLKEYLKRDQ
jgi:hypothetical protein